MLREIGSTREWKDDKGGFVIRRVSAEVVRLDARDYLSEELGRLLTEALTAEFETAERLHCFFDAEHLDAYHSYVRIGVTGVLVNNSSRLASVSVLARSTLVHMGVAVANLALQGRIKPFGERSAFEAALSRALGRPLSLAPDRERLG
jgi:hypothetical protein